MSITNVLRIKKIIVLLFVLNLLVLILRFVSWSLDWYYGDFYTIISLSYGEINENPSLFWSALKNIFNNIIIDFAVVFILLFVTFILFLIYCKKIKRYVINQN